MEAAGGFATVLAKGEREAGSLLVLTTERGAKPCVYERMPSPDGGRIWHRAVQQGTENEAKMAEYLTRRASQDPDLWIIELDIANGERFIGLN